MVHLVVRLVHPADHLLIVALQVDLPYGAGNRPGELLIINLPTNDIVTRGRLGDPCGQRGRVFRGNEKRCRFGRDLGQASG